jgi:uncharacterized protein (TIGR03437 family)
MSKQKYNWISALSGISIGLLFLGFSDTARAQLVTLSGTGVTNNTLAVTVQHGSVSAVQVVNVATTESGTPVNSTVNVQVGSSSPWLHIQEAPGGNGSVNTPSALHITVDATNLVQGTQPSGTITVSPTSGGSVVLTVAVTVSGTSLLSSNPSSLSFTTTVGTPENSVPTQQLTISSSGSQLSFGVTYTTQNGGSAWLVPFNTSGTTGSGSTSTINVGINPAGLAANVYQGSITVQSTTTADSVVINVTLTVAPNTTLSATPATLQPFLYQIGTTAQAGQLTQTLQVASTNTSVQFQVTMNPVVTWLVISPGSGATGASGQAVPVTLSVNPATLGAAVYNTQITVAIIGGTALTPIPVQLVVSTNPLLSLSNTTLSFTSPFGGGTPPASQAVQVTTVGNSSTSVSFSVSSDESWLTSTAPSFNTPSTITVSVNPSSLAVGSYTGHLTVRPNNSDANLYALTITVNLTVGNTASVSAGPPLLVFSWETSQPAPQSQVVELFTVGQPTTFTLTPSVTTSAGCPAGWLLATTTSTTTQGATITVSVNVTGMTPGMCPGTVTVSYPANSTTPQTLAIPVTVNVGTGPLLNVSPQLGFGIVSAPAGGAQITETITLTSTDPATQITDISASSSSNPPWLFLGLNGSSTPQTVQVIINPGTLPANTYAGTISISSSKLPSSPLTIPVTLTITSNTTVTVTPSSLTFNQPSGGQAPAAQSVTLASSSTGATFQTSIPTTQVCSWLQVSPTSGIASGPVAFTVLQNSLPQNSYQCPVTFSFLGAATAPTTVNATLVVGPAQALTVSPASLTFAYQVAGSTPGPQLLTLTSTGGSVAFSASATSNGGWLLIDTTSSATGSTGSKAINVSIDPTKFPAGTVAGSSLTGQITINAGVLAAPITVNVTVNVTAAPVPQPTTIINSAIINGFGAIAPGELIAIKGANLGPVCTTGCIAGGVQFSLNAQGTVNSTLATVQVLFDTIPGTPTYVSPTQINVIVPWEIAGRAATNIVVSFNGVQSAAIPVQVVAVAPGIYTQNATGSGQAAALNQNGTAASPYNGPAGGTYFGTALPTAPAPQGSVVVLYLTGGGLTSPGGVDGSVSSSTTLMPLKNWTPGSNVVTATVGNAPATVLFAGAAPTLITGVVQINLQLPAGVTGNALPVVITIDGQQTQLSATIAAQ